MHAIIISIGDELLIGNTLDTNAHWISNELTQLGIDVLSRWTISDKKEVIIKNLHSAVQKADFVFITGGLGPTNDDLTIESLAVFFHQPLIFHEEIWDDIQQKHFNRKSVAKEAGKKMAFLPKNAIPIPNPKGTAPGSIYFEHDRMIVSMPGVPYEMKAMMQETVLPLIQKKYKMSAIVLSHIYTAGVGETVLSEALQDFEKNLPQNFSLAYLPSVGRVRLRISGKGDNKGELEKASYKLTQKAVSLIQRYVYSTTEPSFEAVIGQILREKKLQVGAAESCTGGYLSHLFTKIPGASDYFKGSIISYSNEIKISALNVKKETLDRYGAVSEQTVSEMLSGALTSLYVDIALAISGIAGPSGGSKEKPVGCVYIGVANRQEQYIKRLQFTNNRDLNIELSANTALVMLHIFLKKHYL
ncbi:MAG: CinA family nicotinamide mononucleotide deamidase-related protein [Chitinophagales bacterium]|nr:CinA family nicotinamide mononucleotide deamidase-related protein [Chitinophagales bacterium]